MLDVVLEAAKSSKAGFRFCWALLFNVVGLMKDASCEEEEHTRHAALKSDSKWLSLALLGKVSHLGELNTSIHNLEWGTKLESSSSLKVKAAPHTIPPPHSRPCIPQINGRFTDFRRFLPSISVKSIVVVMSQMRDATPRRGRALPPILVISFILRFLEAMQG